MSKVGLSMIAAGLYLMLCGVNLAVNRPRIERDLTARTQSALIKANLPVQSVKFDGRDGEIRIESNDPQIRGQAKQVAGNVFGVRLASVVSLPEKPPALRVEKNGDQISITGLVRDVATRKQWIDAAGAIFGKANVRDNFQIDTNVAAPPFLADLARTFSLLAAVTPRGSLELQKTELLLDGTVADAATRDGIDSAAKKVVPPALVFRDRLTVVAAATPTPSPTPSPTPQPTESRSPQAAPPSPAPTRSPHASFDGELQGRHLNFFFDSVRIVPGSEPRVPELVALLKRHPGKRIRIVGYADAIGTQEYNLKLSARRANAILALLVKKGVSAKRIVTEGRGATEFIADNATPDGRAQNRRVEFQVLAG
jgi:outer membrane protein OmpA-like peptidoglycan-associated protein